MKGRILILFTLCLALILSACSSKSSDSAEETTAVQETKDPFALGDDGKGIAIGDTSSTSETETEPITIKEITETRSDGTGNAVLSNGDALTEINVPGALGKSSLSEGDELPQESSIAESSDVSTDWEAADPEAPTNPYVDQVILSHGMSEQELTNYDAVVSYWAETPTLSEDYLHDMFFNTSMFPHLSQEQKQEYIDGITSTYPHDPSETEPWDATQTAN